MTNLSPAAQAVLTAATQKLYCLDPEDVPMSASEHGSAIAAALRALGEYRTPHWDGTGPACHWHPTPQLRRELLNIAAELEAQ
jgi:hypothetical protein